MIEKKKGKLDNLKSIYSLTFGNKIDIFFLKGFVIIYFYGVINEFVRSRNKCKRDLGAVQRD